MNYKEQQAMVDTWAKSQGFEQFVKDHASVMNNLEKWLEERSKTESDVIPKDRWFFHTFSHEILTSEDIVERGFDPLKHGWIEINKRERKYLETKHEGYELGFVTRGCVYMGCYGDELIAERDKEAYLPFAGGIRWVKQEPKYVEYEVSKNIYGEYICDVEHIEQVKMLHELPSIVGFAGVKFADTGFGYCWFGYPSWIKPNGQPATPIAARFYINGETK